MMPVERVLPSLEHVEEGPSGWAHTEPQVRRPLMCAVAGLTEDLARCCHWNARVSCGLVEGIFKLWASVFASAVWAWRGEPAPNDHTAFRTTHDTPQNRLEPAPEVPAMPISEGAKIRGSWSTWRCAMHTADPSTAPA